LGEGILSGANSLKNIFAGALRFITPDPPAVSDAHLRASLEQPFQNNAADAMRLITPAPSKESVPDVFQGIPDLPPFVDGMEDALSKLGFTVSQMMTNLGESILGSVGSLKHTFADALRYITPEIPPVPDPDARTRRENSDAGAGDRGKTITINIGTITLPDVGDAQGFIRSLEGLVDEYGGAPA
jgi:hypothetical protein